MRLASIPAEKPYRYPFITGVRIEIEMWVNLGQSQNP